MQDQVWWVTGASSGIGAALAKGLAARGARLILSGRNIAALEAVADERGYPRQSVIDNGPEFRGRLLDAWADEHGVELRIGSDGPAAVPDAVAPRHPVLSGAVLCPETGGLVVGWFVVIELNGMTSSSVFRESCLGTCWSTCAYTQSSSSSFIAKHAL